MPLALMLSSQNDYRALTYPVSSKSDKRRPLHLHVNSGLKESLSALSSAIYSILAHYSTFLSIRACQRGLIKSRRCSLHLTQLLHADVGNQRSLILKYLYQSSLHYTHSSTVWFDVSPTPTALSFYVSTRLCHSFSLLYLCSSLHPASILLTPAPVCPLSLLISSTDNKPASAIPRLAACMPPQQRGLVVDVENRPLTQTQTSINIYM